MKQEEKKQHPFRLVDWTPKKIVLRLFSLFIILLGYRATFPMLYWIVSYLFGRSTFPPNLGKGMLFVLIFILLTILLDWTLSAEKWPSSRGTKSFLSRKELRHLLKNEVFFPTVAPHVQQTPYWICCYETFLPKKMAENVAFSSPTSFLKRENLLFSLSSGDTVRIPLPSSTNKSLLQSTLEELLSLSFVTPEIISPQKEKQQKFRKTRKKKPQDYTFLFVS